MRVNVAFSTIGNLIAPNVCSENRKSGPAASL